MKMLSLRNITELNIDIKATIMNNDSKLILMFKRETP